MFPAIAIADAIRQIEPDAEILFVGAQGKLEMDRVPKAGYQIEGLWISGLQRKLTARNLLFPVKVASSLWRASAILRRFKADVAVGVGGYASGPLLRMAAARRTPTLIQEQNSFPGITNRLLARKVRRVCVAYEGMERWFPADKIVFTGNPVRKHVTELAGKEGEAATHFGLDPDKPTLLVVGGSLGARTINQSIEAALPGLIQKGYQVLWQTGKNYDDRAQEVVVKLGSDQVKQTAFVERMDLAYALASAVVSRAGAMSVSELCLVGKPCIFVPSPNVAEDHQTKNAMALVEKDAALLVKDTSAIDELPAAIARIMDDGALRTTLSTNIRKLARVNAAERIAEEVLILAKSGTQ